MNIETFITKLIEIYNIHHGPENVAAFSSLVRPDKTTSESLGSSNCTDSLDQLFEYNTTK